MTAKLKLSRQTVLPENGACNHCTDRLTSELSRRPGIERVHLDSQDFLCLHYDAEQWNESALVRAARLAGADLQHRFQKRHWEVSGLDCADCAATVERGLRGQPGVIACQVNLATGTVAVEWDQAEVAEQQVRDTLRALGHAVVERGEAISPSEAPDRRTRWAARLRQREYLSIVLSGLAFALGLLLTLLDAAEWLRDAAFATAMVTGGYEFARGGIQGLLRSRRLNIDLLMTIAAVGAAVLGEWAEGAAVVFLFALGETLESLSMERARRSIRSLMQLAPAEAERLIGDVAERVPVEALRVGDRILVRPGERISMDGVIVEGRSAVDQAPITGESIPVEKTVGDEVFAGSINGSGALEVHVTRNARDNTLSRIIRMVEEAQTRKAASQRFVDRFAEYYTPAVVVGALLLAALPPIVFGWNWAESVHRALVLLVISCPCALVISTPVSIISAVSAAARQGVLIKGGAYLEALGGIKAIAFDKTGTLTAGRPTVTDVVPLDGRTPDEALALAAAVESRSEHPIAQAIVQAAERAGLAIEPVRAFEALTGLGAQGEVNGKLVEIGRRELFAGRQLPAMLESQADALEQQGKTTVVLVQGGAPVALLAVADQVRPEARAVLAQLRKQGVERLVMLTGDNERTARAIADQLGMTDVRANLLPEQKVEAVRALLTEYGNVAMVGDGVNDAPALTTATVGIAMGAAGTDQALEVADVALMADDLTRLPFAVQLSRAARRTIQQNIVFSLGVKALFLLLAVPGLATLWMAVFADDGASLLVTGNGLRLLRAGRRERAPIEQRS